MQTAMLLTMPRAEVTPDHIMQIGMGFWASKALLSAVELGVFTYLADGPKTGHEIEPALGLHPRGTYDFLDALVALGLLARDGDGATGQYRNTAETAAFLDRKSPQYIGGILEMANARLYRFWADLTPALKTGKPQNEIKHSGRSMFDELYADPAAAGAIHGRHGRHLGGELRRSRRDVRLLTLQHVGRHRRRERATLLLGRKPTHASVLPLMRSACREADCRAQHPQTWPERARAGGRHRLPSTTNSRRPMSSPWG